MTKVETKLRQEGNCTFLAIKWFQGTEANGRISWTKTSHEDVNLSGQYGPHSVARLVRDGLLSPDEAAELT